MKDCTHAENEALHEEVVRWVEGWAQRIHDDCPVPMGNTGWGEHEQHEIHAMDERHAEIAASVPAHFKGCAWVSIDNIRGALFFGLHGRLRSGKKDAAPEG